MPLKLTVSHWFEFGAGGQQFKLPRSIVALASLIVLMVLYVGQIKIAAQTRQCLVFG